MVILWKVIPTFTALFEGLNATLPLATRIVIWISKELIIAMPFLVAGFIGGLVPDPAVLRHRRRAGCASTGMLLRMPLVGKILRKVAVARFCRTLGTLIQFGRADPRRPRHHGEDRRATPSSSRPSVQVRGRIERGETIAAPAARDRRVPADGVADDRRRREHGRARHDARQDCGVL